MVSGAPLTADFSAVQALNSGRMGNPHSSSCCARYAYQDSYKQEFETPSLSLIEARIQLVLNDFTGLTAEDLVVHLHTPITEAQLTILYLLR